MKILVCISNVPDTTTRIKLDSGKNDIDRSGIQWIINPWDELALTRALELKEANAGLISTVDVINVGLAVSEPTLRKALAIGADAAFRVDAEATDAYFVACQLSKVVAEGAYDIVLCGIESSDYNGSAVGAMVAELLGYASVSSVSGLQIVDGKPQLNREIDGGAELLELELPAVLIVQKGIALDPRIPSMRGIMNARTKKLTVITPDQVDTFTSYKGYKLPPVKAACKMIDEENAGEMIRLLHTEAKVI
jgi:electron transfer flavoprotein beta subunit